MKSFADALQKPLTKDSITTLQINLGRKCNLSCSHCHVEAGPHRTEELSPEVCDQLLEVIARFPQIQTVDLTGGAPEMNYGFDVLVKQSQKYKKEIIVRSNLTIFFEEGYTHLPEYFAKHKAHVVASLPCYLEDNVDKMRGKGVFDSSIRAIQVLNGLGYGSGELTLDLVYNPPVPSREELFMLAPDQKQLEQSYRDFLGTHFDITFNQLFAITNIPIGRFKHFLKRKDLLKKYTEFLAHHFNPNTVEELMCRHQLSVDYNGKIYDCDFHQMEGVAARLPNGERVTLETILEKNTLDICGDIPLRSYCYGCAAGCGSSCTGALS